MNPELFYTVPKPVLAVGAAVVAVACANTARLVLTADRPERDAARARKLRRRRRRRRRAAVAVALAVEYQPAFVPAAPRRDRDASRSRVQHY
jgi:hypothetical protein